jgi:hypothetical protein
MGAIQVTSSRKGAKSRKRGRKSRSTGTKARARVHPTGEPRVQLEDRLAESLEQQAATTDVLRIISTSPTKLPRVLEVIVKSAARFCGADDVTIFELDRQDVRTAAHWGTIPQEIGVRFPCSRGSVAGRTILDRKPVHVIDLQAEADEFPEGSAFGTARPLVFRYSARGCRSERFSFDVPKLIRLQISRLRFSGRSPTRL